MRIVLVFVFCSLALLLAACGPAATPTPTAVPTSLPTATLAPTATPTPLPTATITPSATPNAAATKAAKATQQAQEAAAKVKSDLEALGIPVDTGSLVYYQTEPQAIALTEHNQGNFDKFTGAEGLSVDDFVLITDITWVSPGASTCGIIFRSEPNLASGAQYVLQILRLSGLPAWDIEYFDSTGWVNSPVRPKTSSAINQDSGAKNQIVLVADAEKFTVYINGVRQGSYYDYSKQRLDGRLGLMAWQDSGTSLCSFENTAVWAY